jgi:hypothetical protein
LNKEIELSAIQLLMKMNIQESRNIGRMEEYYLRDRRNFIYIALEEVEDADFYWSPSEIERFDNMWKKKFPIVEIAKELRRSEIAVFLLSLDRVFRGKIKPRKGWSFW